LKVLVTFAVEPEFAPWKKSRSFVAASVAGFNVYKAMIGSAEVDVVVTGMGPSNARKAMEAVTSDSYAFCISSGFAGALKREHGVGEVLAPAAVRRLEDGQEIRCDAALVRDAVRVDGAKKVEKFLSAGKIADSADEKSRLGLSGDAIEMESFAVLSVAAERNIRAIAVRAISDRFDEEMPVDFSESIGERGQILKGKLALEIASDPLKIPALIRLGRQSKLAAAHLVEFLESYIELLGALPAEETPAAVEKTAHSVAK
jgi:adenosylhomocysteine nucleosidase